VAAERQQPALVACDQIIGLARYGQGQMKIVRGIGRAPHARQRIDVLGELLDLVDQAAGLVWFDEFGHTWLLQRGPQLVDMRRAGQERKFSVQPGVDDSGGPAGWGDQGGHDDVGIEDHAHQALLAFRLARRSARTSLTASSTMHWISSGSASALRALMS